MKTDIYAALKNTPLDRELMKYQKAVGDASRRLNGSNLDSPDRLLESIEDLDSISEFSLFSHLAEYKELDKARKMVQDKINRFKDNRGIMNYNRTKLYSNLYSYISYLKILVVLILIGFLHSRNYEVSIVEYIVLILFVCYLFYYYYGYLVDTLISIKEWILDQLYLVGRYI